MAFDPPTNATTATQMMQWINSTTQQWLFQGIIGTFFAVTLIIMLKDNANTASKSFAAASFITMILAVMARVLDFVPTWFMSIWIIATGLSAIWMYMEGTQ